VPVEVSRARLQVDADGLPPGKHTVLLSAADRDGRTVTARVPLWVEDRPFSWDGALIYQVVLDRFASSTGELAGADIADRHGGDLAGLTTVVESGYFDELGVDALWISPLYRNPEGRWAGSDGHTYTGYHGYWPISTDEVEPAFGTADDVHALVQAAHARGIRVVLDVVLNHVHEEHPYRVDHAADGWFHENPDCICGNYDCPWDSQIRTCWFTEYLPDLSWSHPDVPGTVVDDTLWWAETFDLDGFRVDAVPMMDRGAVRELSYQVRQRLDQGPTRFFLLGETFTGPGDYTTIARNLGPWALDGQFEFPILWALRAFVAWGSSDATDLEAVIAESEALWEGSGAVMSPFVGNHDMSRFLSEAAGHDTTRPWDSAPPQPTDDRAFDKLLMAQALVLSLPGAPVLYYGDELGLAGANDPDNRRPMPTEHSEAQVRVHDAIARLGRARRCSEALRTGARVPLLADGPLYAHLRTTGADSAVVVLNASDAATTVSLPDAAGLTWDAVSGQADLDPHALSIPPWSARVLLPTTIQECAERAR
jgi:glycosidase